MKNIPAIALTFHLLFGALPASAAIDKPVYLNYQSGASFSGTVTFTDDFSSILAVQGILNGYKADVAGYAGTGFTEINWIWDASYNFASASNSYGNLFLDRGNLIQDQQGSYSHWIAFTYDYSDPNNLKLTSNELGNQVDYIYDENGAAVGDFYVAATSYIGVATPVPEPASAITLLFGLAAVGVVARRRNSTRAAY